MARFTVEYAYGDVLSRPGLDLRIRQICTIASLIAQGSLQPQLKFHMDGLLNIGGQIDDLVEIMLIAAAILGFPAAINATGIVRKLISERAISFEPANPTNDDGTSRYRRGLDAMRELMCRDAADYAASLGQISTELMQWSVEFLFGDVLSRDRLNSREKHLAIISMLATVGNRADVLRLHLRGAMHCETTRAEISEALIQISVYAGFPATLNAFATAREVFESPLPQGEAYPRELDAAPQTAKRSVRRERGLAALAATSSASGEAVVHSFDDIAPEIGGMILDHSYGDIFHRSGLEPKTRELTACAALAARGMATTETPLRVHINAALTVGASAAEIVETLLNMLPYSGYPAVQQAMRIVSEEFAKRGVTA